MPGAWELESPSVLVAVITAKEAVPIKWAWHMRNLRLPPGYGTQTLTGMPYGHARNSAVHSMLAGGYKWLLFIDDDVCVPSDAFDKLSSHGLDIVSGLYYRRSNPIGHPVMMHETPKGAAFIDKFRPGELLEAHLVGAGCLLIHRRVFEHLAGPLNKMWFKWMMEEAPEGQKCSEDFFFCREARKAGYKIMVDTSVQCEHIGSASASLQGYGPAGV